MILMIVIIIIIIIVMIIIIIIIMIIIMMIIIINNDNVGNIGIDVSTSIHVTIRIKFKLYKFCLKFTSQYILLGLHQNCLSCVIINYW